MDGMLSQDEINALLNGVDLSADSGASDSTTSSSTGDDLTDIEKDAIGEVANISMGTSATTLFSLVNRKVNITTPIVEMCTWQDVLNAYERPCVFIQIKYTVGLNGTNILVLKEHDVKVITDLMMGGDGTNIDGELSELHLSAISEAMNQMMGSSSTSLSSMLGKTIDISPPEASLVDLHSKEPRELSPFLEDRFVKISFRMQIDDLVDSTLMQLYPLDFAKSVYETLWHSRWEVSQSQHQRPHRHQVRRPFRHLCQIWECSSKWECHKVVWIWECSKAAMVIRHRWECHRAVMECRHRWGMECPM